MPKTNAETNAKNDYPNSHIVSAKSARIKNFQPSITIPPIQSKVKKVSKLNKFIQKKNVATYF